MGTVLRLIVLTKRKNMETKDTPQTREQIITAALEGREQEVMHYQINIDNYSLALQQIDLLPPDEQVELREFTKQLKELLISEKLEQKKSKIMLAVMKAQVS
jgi:hypothetical protein